MFEYVCEYLKINDVEYKEFLSLKKFSAVRIGGRARIMAFPKKEEELVSLICFLANIGCKYKVVGRMTNVLPPDEDYFGVIVKTDRLASVKFDGNLVFAECGTSLPKIAIGSSDNSISGFEELSGIPGSVGAAVLGNAGAYGREILDVFVSMRCCFPSEKIIANIKNDEMEFGYRWSNKKNTDCLVLSCVFKGCFGCKETIQSKISFFKEKRIKSQPTGYPSLGSTFKRPKKDAFAGALIDSCGLKGYSVGGAAISEKHAGFIINKGNATAKDYLSVADVAEKAVYSKFGIKLEREIENI